MRVLVEKDVIPGSFFAHIQYLYAAFSFKKEVHTKAGCEIFLKKQCV
jgi:hypothetical protein